MKSSYLTIFLNTYWDLQNIFNGKIIDIDIISVSGSYNMPKKFKKQILSYRALLFTGSSLLM